MVGSPGVTVFDSPVQLTATEYKLLFELSINAGRVMTHDQLLRRVWGPEYSGDGHLVRVLVGNCAASSVTTRAAPDTFSPSPAWGTAWQNPNAETATSSPSYRSIGRRVPSCRALVPTILILISEFQSGQTVPSVSPA